jgi:YD repeat-containing protein
MPSAPTSTFATDFPYAFTEHRQNAVIAVAAYHGNVASPSGSLTLDTKYYEAIRFAGAAPDTYIEAGDPALPTGHGKPGEAGYLRRSAMLTDFAFQKFGLPADWSQMASYLYCDPRPDVEIGGGLEAEEWRASCDSPRLLVASAAARDSNGNIGRRDRVYRYAPPKVQIYPYMLVDPLFLAHVYEGAALESIVKSAKAASDAGINSAFVLHDSSADTATVAAAPIVVSVVSLDDAGSPLLPPPGSTATPGTPLYSLANESFLRSELVDDPSAAGSTNTFRVPANVLAFLGTTADQAALVRCGGVERFHTGAITDPVIHEYRLQRMIVNPALSSVAPLSGIDGNVRLLPEGSEHTSIQSVAPQVGRSILHYPYRVILHPGDVFNPSSWLPPQPADSPTFIAIVNETEVPNPNAAVTPRSTTEAVQRVRVVQMNAAGVVIRNTVLSGDGETQPLELTPTVADSVVRDARGSVVEHRTAGYHSKDNATPASTGLVEVFVYDYDGFVYTGQQIAWNHVHNPVRPHMLSQPDLPVVPQLVAKGFKFGDQATSWYMTEYHEYHPNNPELVTKDVELSQPLLVTGGQTSASASSAYATHASSLAADDTVRTHTYEFYAATTTPAQGQPAGGSGSIGSLLGQPAASSTTLPFPDVTRLKTHTTVHRAVTAVDSSSVELVEIEHFDSGGRSLVVAHGYRPAGSTTPPSYFDARLRLTDGAGRPLYGGRLSTWPDTTSASSSLTAATISKVRKDRDGRPLRIDAPDGRLTLFLYRKDDTDPNRTIRVTYRGVDPVSMITSQPVVIEYVRGSNVEVEQGRLLASAVPVNIAALNVTGLAATLVGDDVPPAISSPADPAGLTGTGVESAPNVYEKRAQRDAAGRMNGLQVIDPANPLTPLSFGIEYDGFGKLSRVRSATGSITRTVYDKLGRPVRTFRGTADLHEVWGSAMDTGSTNGACDAHYDQDNMILVEGQDYGWGLNDAGLPTVTRRPRAMAANQYELTGCSGVPASTINTIGLVDRTRYDTRMRAVWQEKAPSVTATATRVEATWLDAQDRPYLEAVFAASFAGALGAIDPRSVDPLTRVSAAAVLAKHPLSLTETVYDAQGQSTETRDYDVAAVSSPRYTSVRTWYDHRGRALRVRTPNGTTDTAYDTKGRVASVTDLAGTLELSKTTNTYNDANDTLIEVVTLSRVAGSTSGALQDGVNAVRKRTLHWYDARKNRVATVELAPRAPLTSTSAAAARRRVRRRRRAPMTRVRAGG